MRFIHTADIHLDSPLTGLSAYADAPVELLRTATREAFTNLVTEAISEKVDFLVVAGDLYDGTWRDHNTGIYFVKEMGRLNKAGISVYLLFGNHDAESEATKRLLLPSNVHTFDSKKASTFKIDHLGVALHGRSFKTAATTENLVPTYPDPTPGWLNIGVLHTALEGNSVHPNYAPCSLAELHAKGYQYWALGHVHEYRYEQGASHVVFPGNLQGRHIRETGPRGAVLVTADDAGIQNVERIYVDVLRWHRLDVDVSVASTLTDAVRSVGADLERLASDSPQNIPLAVRVTLTGQTAAHGQLFGLDTQLRAEIIGQAVALGQDRFWIEKLKVETSGVDTDEQIRSRMDAISDLQVLLDSAETDASLLTSLQKQFAPLIGKAPLELHAAVPYFEEIKHGDLAELIRAVRPSLLAYLAAEE